MQTRDKGREEERREEEAREAPMMQQYNQTEDQLLAGRQAGWGLCFGGQAVQVPTRGEYLDLGLAGAAGGYGGLMEVVEVGSLPLGPVSGVMSDSTA